MDNHPAGHHLKVRGKPCGSARVGHLRVISIPPTTIPPGLLVHLRTATGSVVSAGYPGNRFGLRVLGNGSSEHLCRIQRTCASQFGILCSSVRPPPRVPCTRCRPPGRRPPMVSALRPSVQFLFPVRRHQTRRSRGWLIQRVVGGRHELGPVICLFGSEVPEPVLAWLKALHELVAALLVVQTRVLRRRGVTTTHMPAPRAAAKMKPPPASFGALQTPVPTRRNCGINAADLAHDQRLGRRHTTSQGSPAEADVAPQGHRLDHPPLLPMFLRARGTTPFPIPHGVGHTVAVNACTGGSRGSIILPILLLVLSVGGPLFSTFWLIRHARRLA